MQTWLFLFSFFPRFPPFIVIICGGRLFSRAAVTLITPVPLASAAPRSAVNKMLAGGGGFGFGGGVPVLLPPPSSCLCQLLFPPPGCSRGGGGEKR